MLNNPVRLIGISKMWVRGEKKYQGLISQGGYFEEKKYRLLKRVFRTKTDAELYVQRLITKWYQLHPEKKTRIKKGRKFS